MNNGDKRAADQAKADQDRKDAATVARIMRNVEALKRGEATFRL